MNELAKRILTGSVMVAITLLLVFKSGVGFAIFVAMGGAVVGYEFAKLSKMQAASFWILFIIILVIAFISVAGWNFALIVPLLIFFWLKNLFLVFNYPNKKPKNTELRKAINLFLLLTPFVFLVFLQKDEALLLLLLLFIVWGADSFAYFSGKAFGKHKLAPNLSDGKTIEGAIGGLIGVLLITGIWMFITDNLDWKYLPLALITGVFSVVGDLYESIYKREAGVKNSGKLLPGHGGLFDRLDGLLAATPIFAIGLMFL